MNEVYCIKFGTFPFGKALIWLSMILKSSCGDGIRPVSNFDHTGMSLMNISNAPDDTNCN